MRRSFAVTLVAMAALSAAASRAAGPVADHHTHLLSPASAKLINDPPLATIELPEDLARLLRAREKGWNDKAALAPLFAEDSLALDTRGKRWIHGRDEVTTFLSETFSKPPSVTPVSYGVEGSSGHIAGYFTRPLEDGSTRYFGHVLLSLKKGADGMWQIVAEAPVFPGPTIREPITAEKLVEQLDDAGIRRAAVLSVAYWYGSPLMPKAEGDELANVRRENDWTAQQAARFPDRLVPLCSFNPLKEYALDEIDRCAKLPHVKGLKLHLGNSGVDVRNPEHVEKVRKVFARANERRLAIVAHLWVLDETYGREHAEIFLGRILPAAPDIPVQIAHFAGGGPGYTDEALEVYAKAISAGDPRTKNLYFDIATVADGQPDEVLRTFAQRIRQVGPQRVLYGTDMAPPTARESWLTFRTTVPLTDEEFKIIAGNMAPFLSAKEEQPSTPSAQQPSATPASPAADHHAHLLSLASARLAADPLLPTVELPEDLARLLREREKGWNDKAALAPLFTEDSHVLDIRESRWIRGRDGVAEYLAGNFAKPYRIAAIAYGVEGSAAYIAGYFIRPLEDGSTRYFGHILIWLRKSADGQWRIVAEAPTFPGPTIREPISAEQLVAQLDDAGIRRAAVLSVAYWYGNPHTTIDGDEYAKVRAENDWTAQQAARFPDRLVAFCGFNPLKDYALTEIDRCAKIPQVKGLKLHFGNSWVDVRKPEQVEKIRRVFAAANERRLAIAAHLWTDPEYGREDAEIFLNQILPAAPDIPVQIAHFAGGGPGYTDEALAVYADAISAGDPRTKNLYFDIATVADGQSGEALQMFAKRIRQVGLHRVLYGTDTGPPAARRSWLTFRTTVPLTDEELKTIAGNVAPYLR